jgi:isopropylmalate/homocitrate/citramalate synthase
MAQLRICDVGPRDGLQSERVVLPPARRAELCRRLAAAGMPAIEAVSFVRDDRVPAMAGAEEVLAGLPDLERSRLSGLVLNRCGYDRALACGLSEIAYAFPVTDTFGRRNQGQTVAEGIALARELSGRARADGLRIAIVLAGAFGCPFEGRVPTARVAEIAGAVHAAGPSELVLADSIGVGLPWQVRELVGAVRELGAGVGCHFHNTRNTGYVNALTAVECGVDRLDASIGGLGGCPFVPGATGNIATEDLVYLLSGMGHRTGIDLDALCGCARWLSEALGHALDGLVARAGDPCGLAGTGGDAAPAATGASAAA